MSDRGYELYERANEIAMIHYDEEYYDLPEDKRLECWLAAEEGWLDNMAAIGDQVYETEREKP